MAADGVDERSPLLSAPRSGHVTPTAPPYLPESGPGGKARPAQTVPVTRRRLERHDRGSSTPGGRERARLGDGDAGTFGACLPGAPLRGFVGCVWGVRACHASSPGAAERDCGRPGRAPLCSSRPRCSREVVHVFHDHSQILPGCLDPESCSPWRLSLNWLSLKNRHLLMFTHHCSVQPGNRFARRNRVNQYS